MSSILELLNDSERTVYEYIKTSTREGEVPLQESMKSIGRNTGFSEATVHRTISKLLKKGIVGISSHSNKSESNEIIYYGELDVEKASEDPIFDMIVQINQRSDRFKNILDTVIKERDEYKEENEKLREKIEMPEDVVRNYESELRQLRESLKKTRSQLNRAQADNQTLEEQMKNAPSDVSSISYEGYTITASDIKGMVDIDEELVAFIISKK